MIGRLLECVAVCAFIGGCTTITMPSPDKGAQLRLAIAYETGAGVKQDYKKAAVLYRSAGSATSGTTYVYSPPVGRSRGQVLPIRTGPDQAGIPEAKYRLGRLYALGLGVRRDDEKGRKLKIQAREQGYLSTD